MLDGSVHYPLEQRTLRLVDSAGWRGQRQLPGTASCTTAPIRWKVAFWRLARLAQRPLKHFPIRSERLSTTGGYQRNGLPLFPRRLCVRCKRHRSIDPHDIMHSFTLSSACSAGKALAMPQIQGEAAPRLLLRPTRLPQPSNQGGAAPRPPSHPVHQLTQAAD